MEKKTLEISPRYPGNHEHNLRFHYRYYLCKMTQYHDEPLTSFSRNLPHL